MARGEEGRQVKKKKKGFLVEEGFWVGFEERVGVFQETEKEETKSREPETLRCLC